MASLPVDELCIEILLRLPVKSLRACKCVCKSWFKLISDPSFVQSHLDLTVKNNNPSLLINPGSAWKNGICSTSCQSLLSSTEDMYDNSVDLDYPYKSLKQVGLVGSCNGLVCLYLDGSAPDRGFFCLWNPATTEYKATPELPINLVGACAFGYDHKADDYVLVSYNSLSRMEMVFYTLRSNSWKTIQTNPYKLLSLAIVNETFHWLARSRPDLDSSKVLISLDIKNEKFVEDVQLPKGPKENNRFFMNVGVLEGCLSVVVDVSWVRWEVWVMQTYGVQESWTKRHVIPSERIMNECYLRLVWSFKDGEILFTTSNSNKIVLYDPVHAIARERRLFQIEKYVESLVSLNSGIYLR